MVMHARKPQRINDGYFEKHQAHPYQNQKYSGSKGGYPDRYNNDRMRDSPNGNSYRSDSPDSRTESPRDRNYPNKSSYVQKARDKEREIRDYRSRDKYADCVRSPKDKRARESEHRTNHDRSNSEDKRDERERVLRLGDWSEHISSSGKKYYYNCKTEVSQWEKPRDWLEREQRASSSRGKEREQGGREGERVYASGGASSSRSAHDKHSNSSRGSVGNSRDQKPGISYWNSQSGASRDDEERRKQIEGLPAISNELQSWERNDVDTPKGNRISDKQTEAQPQDMDISPGDSTPTSETSYSQLTPSSGQHEPVSLAAALPRLMSHPSTPGPGPGPGHSSRQSPVSNSVPGSGTAQSPSPSTPVSLASLPRLLSQITSSKCSDQEALQTLQTAILLSRQASTSSSTGPLTVDTSNPGMVGGPPTPTHSESQDGQDARRVNSPPSSISSLQSLSQASSSLHALRPQGPHLTPSLANHYRDDLVQHVRDWPADGLEKQCQRLSEEAHTVGSLHCTKVSAELKMARSLVRLAEIQATLQEQRILFLRQQIRDLEELKSQTSFMSDS